MIGGYSGEPQAEYMALARTAALRALEIDESLPEAHAALAVIVQNYDWDWQRAEKEYKRAIELNPSYATGHHWYAEHLGLMGRFDEAFRESERARQLDPFSLMIATDGAVLSYYSRQYDRAIQPRFHDVMELDPRSFPRISQVAYAYVERRMFGRADHNRNSPQRPLALGAAGLCPWPLRTETKKPRLALAKFGDLLSDSSSGSVRFRPGVSRNRGPE